jgi:aryl-alcohol dehydrogenase-like predicted oxidoreductase
MFVDRISPSALEVAQSLAAHAQEHDLTSSQLALLWCKDQPGITAPIIGPRTMEQLEDQLKVLELTLSDEDRVYCDTLVHPGNAVADFHNSNPWMKARIG